MRKGQVLHTTAIFLKKAKVIKNYAWAFSDKANLLIKQMVCAGLFFQWGMMWVTKKITGSQSCLFMPCLQKSKRGNLGSFVWVKQSSVYPKYLHFISEPTERNSRGKKNHLFCYTGIQIVFVELHLRCKLKKKVLALTPTPSSRMLVNIQQIEQII